MNENDNFTELKRLFDLECEQLREKTEARPAHLGGGTYRAPAVVFVKLLDGCSLQESNAIIRAASSIVDNLNSKNFKINADQVEDIF